MILVDFNSIFQGFFLLSGSLKTTLKISLYVHGTWYNVHISLFLRESRTSSKNSKSSSPIPQVNRYLAQGSSKKIHIGDISPLALTPPPPPLPRRRFRILGTKKRIYNKIKYIFRK